MTCREFKHMLASQTLPVIVQAGDPKIASHVAECPTCNTLLQERRKLAGAMQSISLRTAGVQASPRVERALLQAFRQQQPREVVRFRPLALRLSRWFEVGAYAAVAAACLIALFLGYQVLHTRTSTPVAKQNPPTVTESAQGRSPLTLQAEQKNPIAGTAAARFTKPASSAHSASNTPVASTDETLAKSGYTDLMFCDPLSCSSDAQVVRMELPAQGSADAMAGTVLADVVVGDDGMVRAVRIIN